MPELVATRETGLKRLAEFVDGAGEPYARDRNTDFGDPARNTVSMLSPYIRHRLVSEEEIIAAVLERHSPHAAEKFIQEVYWRTYFKGWLEQRPQVWRDYEKSRDQAFAALETNRGLTKAYGEAVAGSTGIDAFDAFARELVETGYLHNHARMWFASIWIFTLRLPWELGADFFMRHLMDGDPASNTLSWRWVAGLHTRGKNYLATRENIRRYTDGRFDPKGLNEQAPPLDGPEPPKPSKLPEGERPAAIPSVLVIHDDDCLAPPVGDLPSKIVEIIAIDASAGRSRGEKGVHAAAFTRNALADAVALHGAGNTAAVENEIDPVLARIERAGVKQVIALHAPVGPANDVLNRLESELRRLEISLVRAIRTYDRDAWPHATKGFFAMKKAIPDLLALMVERSA
ncbi:Deoxyribodipyrimidine photo-lyase [Rhizobium sp. EC-SD404]|nr:Deoxyribodipyrimidine photo-lyase [Rhizobium sp. EC-SD404]